MLTLFALTLFVSSALLFLVQPMVAKMVLPLLGGTPTVWNTCVVFFQAMLLGGYAYAHATTAWLGVKRQAALHTALVVLAAVMLPIALHTQVEPPTDRNPMVWLLGMLLISVGLPFFVVSSSAPLLQKWFSVTRHRASSDPYFLYTASNAGSMLALLSYPFVLEPLLRLQDQSTLWTVGYGALAVLIAGCAAVVNVRPAGGGARSDSAPLAPLTTPASGAPPGPLSSEPPTVSRRLRWIALAAVPSSLMLGVTTFLSTDIAAVPLLWVVPLALYLATFIVAFSSAAERIRPLTDRVVPLVVLPLVLLLLMQATQPSLIVIPLHVLTFVVLALVCHLELAHSRPATTYLTEFYLWISVGGLLGGLFNTILAPLVFVGIAEYPVAIVLACLLRSSRPSHTSPLPRPGCPDRAGRGRIAVGRRSPRAEVVSGRKDMADDARSGPSCQLQRVAARDLFRCRRGRDADGGRVRRPEYEDWCRAPRRADLLWRLPRGQRRRWPIPIAVPRHDVARPPEPRSGPGERATDVLPPALGRSGRC